jgi:hypothetical protein
MKTVREHLETAHGTISAYHRGRADYHNGAIAKTAPSDPMYEFHKSAAAAHEAAAAQHDEMCNECSKAADGDLNKIVPDGVSRVTPNGPGIRMVLRAGQQEPPAVPLAPQFAKFLETEDSEEESLLRS